jgi:hypothetical protein
MFAIPLFHPAPAAQGHFTRRVRFDAGLFDALPIAHDAAGEAEDAAGATTVVARQADAATAVERPARDLQHQLPMLPRLFI